MILHAIGAKSFVRYILFPMQISKCMQTPVSSRCIPWHIENESVWIERDRTSPYKLSAQFEWICFESFIVPLFCKCNSWIEDVFIYLSRCFGPISHITIVQMVFTGAMQCFRCTNSIDNKTIVKHKVIVFYVTSAFFETMHCIAGLTL